MRPPAYVWGGRPVWRCRFCGERYSRVEDLDAVLRHEAEAHQETVRQSEILGPDGQPFHVEENAHE